MGHINIDPASLSSQSLWEEEREDHAADIDGLLKVLIHEVMHVLGFTNDKIRQFPCPAAPSFNRHQLGMKPKPCEGGPEASPIITRTESHDGAYHDVQLLRTPRVMHMARRHFGCAETTWQASLNNTLHSCIEPSALGGSAARSRDCIDAVPFEDAGGEGTKASHWEKRVFEGEVMIGSTHESQVTAISSISLALFEDSGWYTPDYDVADPRCFYREGWCSSNLSTGPTPRDQLLWGKGRGCEFVAGRCNSEAWREPGYFCDVLAAPGQQQESCTLGRRAVGYCTLQEYDQDVPAQYRLFQNPKLGGKSLEDYCPRWSAYSNWDCQYSPSEAESAAAVAQAAEQKGQSRCENCRCFESSLFNLGPNYLPSTYFGCYEHRCLSPTQLQLRIAGEWFDCSSSGGSLRPDGWIGALKCPDAAELCAAADDLGWPEITHVTPSAGPTRGGTRITVSGHSLDGVSGLSICGVPAYLVNGSDAAAGSVVVAETGTAWGTPASLRVSSVDTGEVLRGNHSCHVRVIKSGGRYAELFEGFAYVGPPPDQPDIDLSGGWTQDKVVALFMRLWPYVLSGVLGLSAIQWAYTFFTHLAESRVPQRLLPRART